MKPFVIISSDTETSCGGKEAEIIQLAAQTEQVRTFSRFVLLKKGISFHASRVSKFQTVAFTVVGALWRLSLKQNASSPLLIL